MAAAICLTIGSFSFIIWLRQTETRAYLFFSIASFSASFFALTDLQYYRGESIAHLLEALRWTNVGVYGLLVGLVWFLYYYFKTARLWLAWSITASWTILLIINLFTSYTIVFDQVTGLEKIIMPWGEEFHRLSGTRNIWSHAADFISLVILIYFADASIRLWKKEQKQRALLVGGSVIFFMTAAGIHTPLVDMGLVSTPYMLTFAFLFIVLAMGFEISYSVIRSSQLSKEVIANERRWRSLLEHVQLLVLQLDTAGKIKYANPYFLKLSGYQANTILEQSWFDIFIPKDQRKKMSEAFQSLILRHQHPHYQNKIILKDSEERLISWSNVPLYDLEGRVEGIISIGADITDEKVAMSEIERLKDRLQEENIYLREEIILAHNFREIIGKSDVLKYALTRVEQVAQSDMTVLIEGETGVGKELFARAIHNSSPRKKFTLIKVNCAAIPPGLIESELFGHEKGAFTGAYQLRKGRFELADGGSIFLDEIGEISLDTQAKLLQVIEEGTFERIGGNKTIKVDVRVIAATNRKLKEEVSIGRFREDLYFRLNVYPISIPPLRKRREDIPLLVHSFVEQFSRKVGKEISKISKNTIEMLCNYDWPGNIRELRNVIERAVVGTNGHKLKLSENLTPVSISRDNKGVNDLQQSRSLEELEKEYITKILDQCDWRINGEKGAAKILKLHPNTLRNRMIKLEITRNNV
jgi:PAS domain S-box-containing protein